MDERLHESLDNDDFQSQSPADRRASLKRVSEQLMLVWAQECPGLADDFQRIDERIDVLDRRSRGIQFEDGHRDENTMQKVLIVSRHDAHVHQGEYMALGAMAAPTKAQAFGIPGLSQSDGQVASQGRDPVASLYGYPAVSHHGDPMVSQYGHPAASLHSGSAASRYVEASGYPVLEPDVGSMNIFTPNLGYGQSLNSILQPCSSTVTSVTTTYSLGRPVMSTHVAKQTRPQVSEGGMTMAEESSLYGRIWLPVTHSTPVGPQNLGQTVASGGPCSGCVTQGAESNVAAWVLVSEDKPGLHINHKDSHLYMMNSQVVPDKLECQTVEEMVSQHG